MINSLQYAIVLLPDEQLTRKTIAVSKQLQSFGTRFVLQDDDYYPHVTLFMAQLPDVAFHQVKKILSSIADGTKSFFLSATHYHQDTEGMIEVQYERIKPLIQLQQQVVAGINQMRVGLRKKNPLGYLLKDQLAQASGEEKKNLENYGYDEIGTLFRPHITFTRFITKERMFDTSLLPSVEEFSGQFRKLGLCTLGDNGTCRKMIYEQLFESFK